MTERSNLVAAIETAVLLIESEISNAEYRVAVRRLDKIATHDLETSITKWRAQTKALKAFGFIKHAPSAEGTASAVTDADVVDHLRHTAGLLINETIEDGGVSSLMLVEAADEIERLRPYEVELRRIAKDLGEPNDPFAAWETLDRGSRCVTPSSDVATKALALANQLEASVTMDGRPTYPGGNGRIRRLIIKAAATLREVVALSASPVSGRHDVEAIRAALEAKMAELMPQKDDPETRGKLFGMSFALGAVKAALAATQDGGGPVMAELPEVTWWNGVRGPASNLAQSLETYAKIPPGADRDKWAMDAAAKWIREVIDLNANPVLPDFTEISPGVYVRRDYSPEQLEKLLRRPDSLIASALSAARSNAAPKADGHEEHYGDGWDLRLPDIGGRS